MDINTNKLLKFQQNIFSKDNLQYLIVKLEKIKNSKVTKNELQNFIEFIKQFDFSKIFNKFYNKSTNNININNVNEFFINQYMNELGINLKEFDLHDFLNKEINNKSNKELIDYNSFSKPNKIVSSQQNKELTNSNNSNTNNNFQINAFSKSDQIELTKILNYESLWRDSNILIDSRYQNIANSDRSRIVFNIVSKTKVKTPGSGVITSISNMRDIVEIEIYPFSIPYISMADNYYQKITLSILELSAISIDAYENSQFHFIFKGQVNGNLIDLTPINKTFRFYKPINRINEFSLRFGSPLSPITFDKDRLYTSSINYLSNPGILTFSESHNLITGDLIYIENFNTLTPAKDLNIIEEINNTQGHICTRINNTSISINVDFSQILLSSQIPNLSVLVYFGSKRILLPLKFRYLIGIDE